MTTVLDKAQSAKLLTPPILRLMKVLATAGCEARIVGGAVRDVVMARPLGDIDLATNAPPERVMEVLTQQGIKTVPTGLVHGTITAVIDRVGYEITTLRRDVETDGRHARVVFTDDWVADATRRDFTFNALYCDAQANIYDYCDGLADAEAGYVRFIDDAHTRIREDVLRILRFFRFYAWFGKTAPDCDALSACRALADLIPKLSLERVSKEILKLLAAENPAPTWKMMIENGIAQHCLPEATDILRLQTLLHNEKKYDEEANGLLRLAALLPQNETIATEIATRLRFSNRDKEKLFAYAKLPALMHDKLDPVPLRRILYAHDAENCRAALLLLGQEIKESLETVASWENPIFPIKGEDIMKRGVLAGERVGGILRTLENWWIENDFRPDRTACLGQIDTCRNPS